MHRSTGGKATDAAPSSPNSPWTERCSKSPNGRGHGGNRIDFVYWHVVGRLQPRFGARFAEQAYLQERGQDFLAQEYASRRTLGCIYDWWYSDAVATPAILSDRCVALREGSGELGEHPSATYAATMLYVEETLMHFVEESRMACESGVQYARELDIWRNDVAEDVSGVFSFYMLYRFADPAMARYITDTPLAGRAARVGLGPTEQISHFVRMAKIDGVTFTRLCENAEQFLQALSWDVAPPAHVATICRAPDKVHVIDVGAENPAYCIRVHGGAQPEPQAAWFGATFSRGFLRHI